MVRYLIVRIGKDVREPASITRKEVRKRLYQCQSIHWTSKSLILPITAPARREEQARRFARPSSGGPAHASASRLLLVVAVYGPMVRCVTIELGRILAYDTVFAHIDDRRHHTRVVCGSRGIATLHKRRVVSLCNRRCRLIHYAIRLRR